MTKAPNLLITFVISCVAAASILGTIRISGTSVRVLAPAHGSIVSDSDQGSALDEVGCCGLAQWRGESP